MIKAEEICLRYPDGTLALGNINLKVEQGELVYITGPSGSGKTSLLKLFMGQETPTSGHLEVMGQPITKSDTGEIRQLRKRIGPVFQEFRLIKGRTAMENVILGMRFLDYSRSQMNENTINALVKVGLEHKANSLVENLSWGERQRIAIARAVARKPSLILADEPTGNLDHDNALKILELLNSFRDKNTSVIITTHATHLIGGENNVTYIRMEQGSICRERLGSLK
ncbi:MAG: transporter [Clostridiales bacterium]|jgi:cell division transport system ATP-binding protein|nr:transporter [Clostridiales bacterium]